MGYFGGDRSRDVKSEDVAQGIVCRTGYFKGFVSIGSLGKSLLDITAKGRLVTE